MSGPAKYPGQAALSDYGDGGFRFAGMSHQGSLLLLPSGIYAWDISEFSTLKPEDFQLVFLESSRIEFLLLGCGSQLLLPNAEIRAAFDTHDIGLETMDTGAAVRTYNVLLAEGRNIAAGLIAVDNP
jgi:uncharacterized protein